MLTLDIALLLKGVDKLMCIKNTLMLVKDAECILDRYIKYLCHYKYIEVLKFIRNNNLFIPYYVGNYVLYAAHNGDLPVIKWLFENCEIDMHYEFLCNYLNEEHEFTNDIKQYLRNKIDFAILYPTIWR